MTVSGWCGDAYLGPDNCVTDDAGSCKLVTPKLSAELAACTATVEDITHTEYGYGAAPNADPDGDSDGTAITVHCPW